MMFNLIFPSAGKPLRNHWKEPYIFRCDIKNPMRRVTQYRWMPYVGGNEGLLSLQEGTEYRIKKPEHDHTRPQFTQNYHNRKDW
jgi:hypothetical protein